MPQSFNVMLWGKIWILKNFENWNHHILKWENDHNSAPGTLIKKVRPLYYLQLLKLKIIKWSCFLARWLWCWVMAIFSFQYARVSIFKVFQCPYFFPRAWHWNPKAFHLSRNEYWRNFSLFRCPFWGFTRLRWHF